jgi:diacylglycerol kinase family enzyme
MKSPMIFHDSMSHMAGSWCERKITLLIDKMRYAIIANPASGKESIAQKQSLLVRAAEILNAEIHGLDTTTSEDFCQCARELTDRCDVLVIAGGDGTLSDIINCIDTAQKPVAFLPLGTGNAMQYALDYRGSTADIAMRIREGEIHQYDLVNCQGKTRGFILSVGIEGSIIQLRDEYVARGYTGFKTYLGAFMKAFVGKYKRTTAEITVDDTSFEMKNLLSLIVIKQPYYGFGMKIVPRARFDDRLLHILSVNSRLFKCAIGVATSFTGGNRIGQYRTGHQLDVKLERPLALQIDGKYAWHGGAFTFTVLPKALKIKC